jgi:hypothetical protein
LHGKREGRDREDLSESGDGWGSDLSRPSSDVRDTQVAMARDSQEWWPRAQTWSWDVEGLSGETTVEIM